jgi:hypothetical protein
MHVALINMWIIFNIKDINPYNVKDIVNQDSILSRWLFAKLQLILINQFLVQNRR